MPGTLWTKHYGERDARKRRSMDKVGALNSASNRYINLKQDKANPRVKKPTSSLFYYADGEARRIKNNNTGKTIKATTFSAKLK